MCNSNKCAICECDDKDVPGFWKRQKAMAEKGMGKSHLLTFNTQGQASSNNEWCQTVKDVAVEHKHEECVYVNLPDNKESFTAYNGSQIWNAIYAENCLLERLDSRGINPHETCSEETLLY